MRRPISRLLGLILLVTMIAGQASITVLAQSTPGATPSASPEPPSGITVTLLGFTPDVDNSGNNHWLVDVTAIDGSKPIPMENVPSSLLRVNSGEFKVTIDKATAVTLRIGGGGPIYADADHTILVCKTDCDLLKDHPDVHTVFLGQGNAISLKDGTFSVQVEASPPATPSAKAFSGGSGNMTGAIVGSGCTICPRPS